MKKIIDVKIKYLSDNKTTPVYATKGSAGTDLRACIDGDIVIAPFERIAIPTGIAIELPSDGYAAFIFARSGLGLKKGLTLPNAVGVIDSDYTGEIMVAMTNIGDVPQVIKNGDRIAQMVIMQISHANFIPTDDISQTARGAGGFGSTGHA